MKTKVIVIVCIGLLAIGGGCSKKPVAVEPVEAETTPEPVRAAIAPEPTTPPISEQEPNKPIRREIWLTIDYRSLDRNEGEGPTVSVAGDPNCP
jgi:hypothetical protein